MFKKLMGKGMPANASLIISSFFSVAIAAVLVRKPQWIFTFLPWWIILVAEIGFAMVSLILSIISLVKNKTNIQTIAIQWVTIASTVALTVLGICVADTQVYHISTPTDLNALNHFPPRGEYHVEFENDIDFSHVSVQESYGGSRRKIIINGKGHTLKGIQAEIMIQDSSLVFLNVDIIQNLNIEDCAFLITPDYYVENEGKEVSFYLIPSDTMLGQTTIKGHVHILPAEYDIRHRSESWVGTVYPDKETEAIQVQVTREEV